MKLKKSFIVCEHETHRSGFPNLLRTNNHSFKTIERKNFTYAKQISFRVVIKGLR